MDNISPLTSISAISSSTSQGGGRSPQQQTPEQGKFLRALVLEAQGNNRFVLDIGGTRQPVHSEAALSPGQSLRLQVVKTEPQIELQIISTPFDKMQGLSLTLLGKSINLEELFQAFQLQKTQAFDTVSLTSRSTLESFYSLQLEGISGEGGGGILKNLIDRLGLNLEQLLARGDKNSSVQTLKAALLEIAHNFKSANNIAETTHRILATLELFQLTQLQVSIDNHLIFPLPLPFIEKGYLIVDSDDKNSESTSGSKTESRFSLHLTVSALGNIQIDFLQNLEGLFIRFRAADKEKAAFIESFATELKEAISNIPLISLSFSSDAPDPIHDLVRHLNPEGNSMLDTKA